MSEPELVQKRLISGKGVLSLPSDAVKNRYAVLYATVVRKPKNPYLNLGYNPPRARYGVLVFLRQGYVVDSKAIEYEKQAFDAINDICGQTLHAVKCAYAGTLQSIYNLAVSISGTPGGIGLNPTTIDNTIKDYTNLRLGWDECRLVCYADAAIELQMWRQIYDICDDANDNDQPPPPPDPPHDTVPPGTPLDDISPPYDSETNDNDNTQPYPGDETPPPEPPPDSLWEVVYLAYLFNGTTRTQTRQWKYPYNDPVLGGEANSQLTVQHSGTPGQTFIPLGYNSIAISVAPGAFPPPGGVITGYEILSETQLS
jgi:hypothetical protein